MRTRVLIVDSVAGNRIVLHARLSAAHYEPILAEDGARCLAIAREERPDLVVLAMGLPDLSGLEVLRHLRHDLTTRDLPIIALTSTGEARERLAALAAGADDVIDRGASDRVLLSRLRNLLRARIDGALAASGAHGISELAEAPQAFEPQGLVALVPARAQAADDLSAALSGLLRDQLLVLSRGDVLAEADRALKGQVMPEVFLIHHDPSDPASALRLLSELKSHPSSRHAAVCLVGPAGEGDNAAMAFDLGADDAVGTDVTATELAMRTRALLRRKRHGDRQRARMQDGLRLALIDPLTGLYNRRFALPHLTAVASSSNREGTQFTVMVVDLDHFKTVNDVHGHAIGDQVLVDVARRLQASLRDSDVLARIGGEEFLVILPQCCMTVARGIAERLCGTINDTPVRLTAGQVLPITVSIGVAVAGASGPAGLSVEALVEQADLALLDSKGSGRNQVTYRQTAA